MIFDDLPGIFTGTFGQVVEINSEIGATVEINAIIRTEDDDRSLFDGSTVRSSKVMHAQTADIAHMSEGDLVFIGTSIFKIGAKIDDRHGMTRMPLHPI